MHFRPLHPFVEPHDEMYSIHSSKIGGQNCKLLSMFIIREHHIVAVVGYDLNLNDEDEDAFDGHWFGASEGSFEAIIYHIPTHQEMYRCSLPPETLSVSCSGDTLAISVSHLGFILTGGNVSDVARAGAELTSPVEKKSKEKKKRNSSGAVGRNNKTRGPKTRQR